MENLDARRSRLLGRLITRLALAYQRQLLERGHVEQDIPASQKALLIHVETGGSRASMLADRLEISKQAVSKLVQELEAKDYVERRPDASDGRAHRICFTARGRALVDDTVAVFEALDREAVEVLGERQAASLRRLLTRWAAHLDPKAF